MADVTTPTIILAAGIVVLVWLAWFYVRTVRKRRIGRQLATRNAAGSMPRATLESAPKAELTGASVESGEVASATPQPSAAQPASRKRNGQSAPAKKAPSKPRGQRANPAATPAKPKRAPRRRSSPASKATSSKSTSLKPPEQD